MSQPREGLKERLESLLDSPVKITPFVRTTRNKNYVVESVNGKRYFVKSDSWQCEKERLAYDFLRENPIVEVVLPAFSQKGLLVFPFHPELRDSSLEENVDFITDFHNKAFQVNPKIYHQYFGGATPFENLDVKRFASRLRRHEEEIGRFWPSQKDLRSFAQRTIVPGSVASPIILAHGDLQHKNLQTDSDGVRYVVDFEDAYLTGAAWDIGRALLDVEPEKAKAFVNEYFAGLNFSGDEESFRKEIDRDFVINVITTVIARQQRLGVDGAMPYLETYREKYKERMNGIVNGEC